MVKTPRNTQPQHCPINPSSARIQRATGPQVHYPQSGGWCTPAGVIRNEVFPHVTWPEWNTWCKNISAVCIYWRSDNIDIVSGWIQVPGSYTVYGPLRLKLSLSTKKENVSQLCVCANLIHRRPFITSGHCKNTTFAAAKTFVAAKCKFKQVPESQRHRCPFKKNKKIKIKIKSIWSSNTITQERALVLESLVKHYRVWSSHGWVTVTSSSLLKSFHSGNIRLILLLSRRQHMSENRTKIKTDLKRGYTLVCSNHA